MSSTLPINYQKIHFLTSALELSECPEDNGVEVALLGRSNVGKSSALNALTEQKKLARISKAPGRTQRINFFQIDAERRLVDLPGYGYAKVSATLKKKWRLYIDHYLSDRKSLRAVVLLMDIRHPFMPFDQHVLKWSLVSGMPVHIVLTKMDKLNFGVAKQVFNEVSANLAQCKNTYISLQMFSSLKRTGVEELRAQLAIFFNF